MQRKISEILGTGHNLTRAAVIEGAEPVWPGWMEKTVHDWRGHVPEAVRAIWHTFTREQLAALYDWAEALADAEIWE